MHMHISSNCLKVTGCLTVVIYKVYGTYFLYVDWSLRMLSLSVQALGAHKNRQPDKHT